MPRQKSEVLKARRAIELGWRQSQRNEVIDASAVFAMIRELSRARRENNRPQKGKI